MFNNLKNKLMDWLEINKTKQDYNKYKINNDNHKITLREEICKTKLLIIDINRKFELYDEQLELIKNQFDALNKTLESNFNIKNLKIDQLKEDQIDILNRILKDIISLIETNNEAHTDIKNKIPPEKPTLHLSEF